MGPCRLSIHGHLRIPIGSAEMQEDTLSMSAVMLQAGPVPAFSHMVFARLFNVPGVRHLNRSARVKAGFAFPQGKVPVPQKLSLQRHMHAPPVFSCEGRGNALFRRSLCSCPDLLQASVSQFHHPSAVVIAALLDIILIHFQLRHRHGKEVIADPVKDVPLAEDDELVE